ncbi:NAD-dependent epimerase/dehydratase family protein [Streptomyces sp. 3MP-14]|uniref:NAD-dependent epimerase/dehydratase family protein n=2 Tax=Streptomyces TaxID=1883 RepID=A0A5N5ZZI2_9ACTN|nr:NAD-dependent epimerase/dehydratase family protein [Streptomyces mimosae]KAB8173546.1 NAD-dependent epimerase/dehydratase family protein [Streptomyces sp. 3MP-14]
MPGGPVLVSGGTGFVGSAVVRQLLRRAGTGGPRVRVLSRRPPPRWMTEAGVAWTAGDLSEPATLRGVGERAAVLLHLSSYVGRDPERCWSVNGLGTAALMREARRAGIGRICYVSTASVYGTGPHRGPVEGALTPAPASTASASRLRAEEEVRAHGGVVLRPNLVFGAGDRWFVPTLARLLAAVPAWPDGGRARLSVIAVSDLARLVAALAFTARPPAAGSVWHASHPEPVRLRVLARRVCEVLDLPPPSDDLPCAEHRSVTARELPEMTDHQHALLSRDHFYDSSGVWRALGLTAGPGYASRMAEALRWYGERSSGGRS